MQLGADHPHTSLSMANSFIPHNWSQQGRWLCLPSVKMRREAGNLPNVTGGSKAKLVSRPSQTPSPLGHLASTIQGPRKNLEDGREVFLHVIVACNQGKAWTQTHPHTLTHHGQPGIPHTGNQEVGNGEKLDIACVGQARQAGVRPSTHRRFRRLPPGKFGG